MMLYVMLISIFSAQSHSTMLLSKNISPMNVEKSLSFHTKKINIAGQTITRSTPIFDDIPIEGADDIFNGDEHKNQFHQTDFRTPSGTFRLNAAECIEKAITAHGFSTLKNPYVEPIDGLYEQVWLMHFDEPRPAFKIRLPTISIFYLKDIYVDADNGDILRIDDAAQFIHAPTQVFVYSPKTIELNNTELRSVALKDLVSLEEDGFLRGEYMNVRTCCKYYTCPDEGPCTDNNKRCALKSHTNAQQSREILELPTATLGLDPLISLPPTISVDTVRCTYLPFARASYKNDNKRLLGFFDKPIDDESPEAEMDRFSEIQAYYSMMSFFKHIRLLLNDNTWCLRDEAMSCNSDGSPVVDARGNPKNPYRIFVNQMIPDMKVDGPQSRDADSFIVQVLDGKGSRDNPVKLNSFMRMGNAAFIPALSTLKKNAPRADEILSDLIKPYDHNVFFQGDRDFAYDGDVVFHEFMHAITTSLINKINSLGLDKWGIHSEPGSLNEAWSDYFSAAFTNDPAVGEYASIKGGYGEVALRNIENEASCPQSVIGEIHNDSLVWSGALWEIRSVLKKTYGITTALEFDRAVLASLAQAKNTEDFKTQSEKLLANLRLRDGLGEKAAAIASRIFEKRGIRDCFRAYTLASVDEKNRLQTRIKDLLFVPSRKQIGLKNYAPSTSQLETGIPAGAKSMTLSWRQFLGGTGALLGTETTPYTTKNVEPLKVLTSIDTPIAWKFQGARSIPTRFDQPIEDKPINAAFHNGYWQVSIPLDFGRCDQKTLYISLLSTDFKYVLQNLNVQFDLDHSQDRSDCVFFGNRRSNSETIALQGCSTTDNNLSTLIIVIVFTFLLRRRPKTAY